MDKNSPLVSYHNDLNTVLMRNWTALEMNIFFAIIGESRDKGTNLIKISCEKIRNMTDKVENRNKGKWYETLKSSVQKIGRLYYYQEDKQGFTMMLLFQRLKISQKAEEIEIKVSEDFEYIVNQLTTQFTVWELKEFTDLKSSYAKTMYRLLKQWRTLGHKTFTPEELKLLLNVPDSYSTGMLKKRVLEKSIKELQSYFVGLKYKAVKENSQGNPVSKYVFTWEPEKTSGHWIQDKFSKYKDKNGKRFPKGWKIENGIYYKNGKMVARVIAEEMIEKERNKN